MPAWLSGRALASHARGQKFESSSGHHFLILSSVASLLHNAGSTRSSTKKKPTPSFDAWVSVGRGLSENCLATFSAAFLVFALFVAFVFVALVVVVARRRRPLAFWGHNYSVWSLDWAVILLLGKRACRQEAADCHRHCFSFQVEHRISCPPHAFLSAHGRESKRCADLNRARTVPET